MENKIYKLSDSDFIDLIKSSTNISEVLFKLNLEFSTWGVSQVKKRMTDLNFYNFKGKNLKPSTKKINIFHKNSKHCSRILKSTIIKNNLLPYKCAICGTSKWNNKTLSLEINHINGITSDNRLENLRFLCPNCNSQITTLGSPKQKTNQKYVIQYDENKNEIRRFGSINECCKFLIDNNYVKTKLLKTCRNNLNKNNFINNYYFEILDA